MREYLNHNLISVIIPCYNYGGYIKECLDSVFTQTYPDIEAIVVDNGSTDNSAQVIQTFDKVNYLRTKTNLGPSGARNYGAKHASGKYLVFLDADDKLSPEYVSDCMKALADNPSADFAYTDMQMFGRETHIHKAMPFDAEYLKREGNYINIAALVDKHKFIEVGGFKKLPAFEDWDLWLRMVMSGSVGAYVSKPLYYYRRHQGSRDDMTEPQKQEIIRSIRDSYPQLRKYNKKKLSIKGKIKSRLKKLSNR